VRRERRWLKTGTGMSSDSGETSPIFLDRGELGDGVEGEDFRREIYFVLEGGLDISEVLPNI
jgi:hypothetical protein